MATTFFSFSALAGPNPSANVENGGIRRYGATPGVFTTDIDFNTSLSSGDVRLSQQVIADNDDMTFNVELKAQGGSGIRFVSEQAIVLVIDRSGSMAGNNWTQTINACVALVNSYPADANVYFGIVTFETNASIVSYLTNNRNQVITTLRSIPSPTGGTNTADGLTKAKTVLDLYSGRGAKSAVVITDGASGSTAADLQNAANALKNSGVVIYAVGIGGYNPSQLQSMASVLPDVQTVFGVTNLSQLSSIFASFIKNVIVSMGADIDYLNVISGANYSYNSSSGILTWNLSDTAVNTLVYRIRLKQSAVDQGFKPVSSSSALLYTDTQGRARNESFDIPKVQYISRVTYTVAYYKGSVAAENLLGVSEPATVLKNTNVIGDINLNAMRPVDYKQGVLASGTVISQNGQVINVTYAPKDVPVPSSYDFAPKSGTFDGQPHPVTVAAPEWSGNISGVYYNGSPTGPVHAGTYAVSIDIESTETHVAASGLVIGSLVIDKKLLTIDELDFDLSAVSYDRTAHTVSVEVNDPLYGGALTILYNGSPVAPQAKGDYLVTAVIVGSDDYYYAEIDLGIFTIEPSAKLIGITIAGKKESLALSGEQLVYYINVPTNNNEVTVSAVQIDPDAVIAGLGVYKLHPSEPTAVIITVTAENGVTMVYILNLVRVTGNGNGVMTIL